MHRPTSLDVIKTNLAFESYYREKVRALLNAPVAQRGPAHAMSDETTAQTLELLHVTEYFGVDLEPSAWQEVVQPNLPWAEDHFQERISGLPLNPAPSEAWWPFARQGNAEHKKDEKFSHTYPERFWPKFANEGGTMMDSRRVSAIPHVGLHFEYGDLNDLIFVLKSNPYSRQAYLPIWFPEDLQAARLGERVPCSLGYHFIYDPQENALDCVYTLRSCDIVRFYRDDIYMAGRLLQHLVKVVGYKQPGKLVLHVANLHCFPGDRPFLENLLPKHETRDRRSSYNFDALG